jgi:predicted dehydrogenase
VPSLNRRRFVKWAAAAGAWSVVPGCATSPRAPRPLSPGAKLNHACIGVGGMMGGNDLKNFVSHPRCEVVAICDVDRRELEKAALVAPNARRYSDWREMLRAEGDRIDSVSITVPDHMHAAIAMSAMLRGKHVYCQKPLCHDVAECRALATAARTPGLVTQLGTQHASGAGDRQAVEWLRSGVIGKVKHVVLCANRPGAEKYRLLGPRPPAGSPPPSEVSWDLWLGTAPTRPYSADIYHPVNWRSWLDFGTGWSGDIGCHIFDAVWKGLGLTAPLSVRADVQDSWAQSPARRSDTWPQTNHITWVFPGSARTVGPELTVEWYDGDKYPPEEVQALARADGFKTYPGEAAMVIGTEGAMLLPHTSGARLLPREKFAAYPRTAFEARNHYHHFVDACLGGERTESHFVQTGPMTEAILLGTVAVRVPGTTLNWDPARMRVTNSPEAQRLLRRRYRSGWGVSGL